MGSLRPLHMVALLLIMTATLGAVIAISAGLPYEFGGMGNPNDVLGDFLSGGGTGLSPPLTPMLLLVIATLLSIGKTWRGTVGVLGLIALGALVLVADSQEPFLSRTLGSQRFGGLEIAIILVSVLGIVLSLLLVVLGVLDLASRWQASRKNPRAAP